MYKKYCENCNKEVETYSKIIQESITIKGDLIDNIQVELLHCKECNHIVFDFELEVKSDILVADEYRKRHSLLTTQEIVDTCKFYDITDKELSILLGFGEKTIYRYKHGTIQDKSHDSLLRLIQNPINMLSQISNMLISSVNISAKLLKKVLKNIRNVYLDNKKQVSLTEQINVAEFDYQINCSDQKQENKKEISKQNEDIKLINYSFYAA